MIGNEQINKERYYKALHAVQTGVAMMENDLHSNEMTPKHFRVGINSAMIDSSALAKLLIHKSIITQDEYAEFLANEMEKEVKIYENKIKKNMNIDVILV